MTTQYTTAGHAQIQASRSTTTTDRFHLEQQMLDCWQIVDDIYLMEEMGAPVADVAKVALAYDYKFKRMWATFEALVKARKL